MVEHVWNYWTLTRQEALIWLSFSKKSSRVNSLDLKALSELNLILSDIEADQTLRGLIITSEIKTVFMLGTDVHLLNTLPNTTATLHFMNQGQRILARLAALKLKTVALIEGLCFSGGLELALACHYRVAVISPYTRFGFPDIKLGLHPGWGGTVRLARLLGGVDALRMLLEGKSLSAKRAFELGLVDCLIPEEQTERAVLYYIKMAPPSHSTQRDWLRKMSHWPGIRNIIATLFRHRLRKEVNPKHYPAPYQIVSHWRKMGVSLRAFRHEALSVSHLIMTPTARALMHRYFLRQRLNMLGKKAHTNIKFVHICGLGQRGRSFAAWCALHGCIVTLHDPKPQAIAATLHQARCLFEQHFSTSSLVHTSLDRLVPDPEGHGLRRADWIIEAICEDRALKQQLFSQWETQCQPQALFVTTSAQCILSDLQKSLKNPQRLMGFHCFHSIEQSSLIEVIYSEFSDKEILEQGFAFIRQLNRLPLPVHNSPGFLINRLFFSYLLQAIRLWEQGTSAALIDRAACHFGFALGPLAFADQLGLDHCLTITKILATSLHWTVPKSLEKMVEKKQLGINTGQGFYRYPRTKPFVEKPLEKKLPRKELILSLLEPMKQEALRCLREQVVEDRDLLDAGLLFGMDFPAFRGRLLLSKN
jgi:3-hydroxyacyl-CoA dehydrogenase / enoyl-CoA hydratase / 3-hydroxybutyryl-CoA epimerase